MGSKPPTASCSSSAATTPSSPKACGICPSGKANRGEPITDTAVRELHEETGPTVQPQSLKIAHIIHGARGVEAPNGFLTVVFAAHEWTGGPENREPRKHAQVRWIDVDAIPAPFVDTTASALDRYLNTGPDISLNGWKQ
jgi:ADP-ribose pyrophosphatase YjhB (NUDIX family)